MTQLPTAFGRFGRNWSRAEAGKAVTTRLEREYGCTPAAALAILRRGRLIVGFGVYRFEVAGEDQLRPRQQGA